MLLLLWSVAILCWIAAILVILLVGSSRPKPPDPSLKLATDKANAELERASTELEKALRELNTELA